MDSKHAIRSAAGFSSMVFKGYLDDLQDEDLQQTPGDGCNPLGWQIGHLISSEVSLLGSVCPEAVSELPDGFAEAHSKEALTATNPPKYLSLAEYMALYDKVREDSSAALEQLSDADLDKPSPEQFQPFCPGEI